MAKKKKYDTSHDDERKRTIEEKLQGLNAATLLNLVKSLWSGFIRLWEDSHDLRCYGFEFFLGSEVVMDFLGRLDRAMVRNLPAELVKTLEGRCGK